MELNKKPTYQDLEKQINELKSKKQLKHSEALLESDKTHRDVLEASIDLICVVDKNGKILFVNHTSNTLYGLSAKKCLGKSIFDFTHPEDKEYTRTKFVEWENSKNNHFHFENRQINISGKIFETEWQVNVERKGTKIIKITSIIRDITKQNITHKELINAKEYAEESEERFRLLMQNMEAGIVVHAADSSIILNNTLASEILGLSDDQMRGKKAIDPAWKFVKPDKSPLPFTEYPVNQIISSKKAIRNDVFGISQPHKDDIVWVKVNGYPELSNTGEITKIVISFIDITEQKYIEEDKISAILKLENSEKRLKQTERLAQVGSWFIDIASQKVEWSDQAFKMWGFDSKKGTPDYDSLVKLIHGDDLELFNSSYEKAVNLCIPYDIEFRICLSNEEQKTIRAICEPMLGDDGKVASITGSNQDITSQKAFEKAQIKHQRIKAIGEMSSSIAHDFNNSLQQMAGNLEVIKLQNDYPENTNKRLNNIGSIISDAADRVSALQKFGDTKYDDIDTELIDFNTLINESLMQSRPLWKDGMEKNGLKINVITDLKDIPKIIGNKGELKSAIYNLIKNSVEAMPEGGDIIIKTGTKGKEVFATFTDTGIGMNEETKTKVFEPFFSTKGFKLGRGLGMSGVFNLIKKHNGSIVVKSSVLFKGSTFKIVFPIGQNEDNNIINKNKLKTKSKLNILWVDDDASITEVISELLELIGHKCTIANNGKNALEHLSENTCDIVFTDIGMSGMNGWELIAAIRNSFGNQIKIITVSGWNIDEKTKEEHTIDFVLQKPFTIERLEEIFLEL